ncbi:MAG TPA: S8 family serine peptidase [Gaiellaceae bacterium]|nr:S8 family serine peptidase [Gaiellaceae bacterium]
MDTREAPGTRASALWGTGNRGGDSRSSALWGKRGDERRSARVGAVVAAIAALVLALPAAAVAGDKEPRAYVPAGLLEAAEASPQATFDVIVEGRPGASSDDVAASVSKAKGASRRRFASVDGVLAQVSGKELLKLARHPNVLSITPDSITAATGYENAEMWRDTVRVRSMLDSFVLSDYLTSSRTPAIAIVDSGVDATKLYDFGGRVAQVNLCSLCSALATGDDYGHGTMVAALAAGSNSYRIGVAPRARIVSLRTADSEGRSRVSDVIAAADWILANRSAYNVRVANFSLARSDATSIRFDPLARAVERLWFAGVVVVAAAGNHGSATGPVAIKAPGNDPFVITVGAVDQRQTSGVSDDLVPSWSAWGTTKDGFAKPELAAPGRYLVAAVPGGSTLRNRFPERATGSGTMWMSGTSFSSAIVAGMAADLLAVRPWWTPDQVKGALMLRARPLAGQGTKAGVGEVDVYGSIYTSSPGNPNAGLYQFVTTDASGARRFDGDAWAASVSANSTWSTAAWSEAAWSEAAWSEAAWSEAAWSEAAWSEAAWSEAAWSEAAWSEAAWSEAAWSEAAWAE